LPSRATLLRCADTDTNLVPKLVLAFTFDEGARR